MTVGDVAVLRAVGRYQDQNISNNLHYEVVTQTSEEINIWQSLAEIWDAGNTASWLARMIDAYELIGLKVFTAKGDSKVPGIVNVGTAGDVVGDPQESFVCRTITMYTDNANHRVRGRIQLSGAAEAMFNDTDGSVTDAELTALSTLISNLLSPLSSGGDSFKPVIINQTTKVTNDVVEMVPRKTPSVVRSRRVRQFSIG